MFATPQTPINIPARIGVVKETTPLSIPAPANPNNPRHAKILAMHAQATTIDWLARDPRGTPYTNTELEALKERSL
jgi:hypothetical protein